MLLDKQARTAVRRIELFLIYLFAVSVGANGIGGAFGHLFLSDLIAESVGWPTGSPFQLEMGFANLLVGVLGIVAIGRRDGFRAATIVATTILGVGASIVHLQDIIAHGNLAPGNTIINLSNLLDPILLIGLTWLSGRSNDPDAESVSFQNWQQRLQPYAAWATAGVGTGFAVEYLIGIPFIFTIIGALLGVGIGRAISRNIPQQQEQLAAG
jgi:hypothetical protein